MENHKVTLRILMMRLFRYKKKMQISFFRNTVQCPSPCMLNSKEYDYAVHDFVSPLFLNSTAKCKIYSLLNGMHAETSVSDPDVFGPPEYGFFHRQAKKFGKT